MQNIITQTQRENLTKALPIFLEAVRKYIVTLLSRQFGNEQWPQKYKAALSPDQQVNWEKERLRGREPHDLIDYPHLSSFAYQYKELLRPDFQKEAGEWGIHFKRIYDIRNRINHYENKFPKDLYAQFWIYARAFALGIKDDTLYKAMTTLEHALPEEEAKAKTASYANDPAVTFPNAAYFLPVLVRGQKAHVVHLYAANEKSNTSVREFIFEQNADQIHLFSLIEGIYQGRTTAERNQTCHIRAVAVSDRDLVVTLEKTDKITPAPVETPADLTVDFDSEHKMQRVLVRVGTAFERIVFHLQHENQTYEGTLKATFAPSGQIYDVALDFGSEASQVVVHQRGTGKPLHRKKLLSLMQETYFPDLTGPFHQQDADDELFRSQVFVLKEGVILSKESTPNQFKGNDAIRTLTKKDKIDELKGTHALIPNPKLAHLGVYNFRVRYKDRDSNANRAVENDFGSIVSDIQQIAINHFLHTLLHNIHAQKNDTTKLYVNINYLVPNILEQSLLTHLVNETYRFLAHPGIVKAYHIGGAEVTTLSESDASFLGYWSQSGIHQQNGNYLIVDVGKGTTDFSIIKSDALYNLSSEYRSGFIGAGNVITYAFIETILTAFLGGDEASWEERKGLLKIIASEKTDIAGKYNFLEIVEQFKRNFKRESATNKPLGALIPSEKIAEIRTIVNTQKAESNALALIIQALENIFKQQDSIRDDFGFINNAVQKLVLQLKRQVVVSDIETVGKNLTKLTKIVLTGRGFLFGMLVDEIRKELGKSPDGKDRIVIQQAGVDLRNELKKICLSGAFSGRTINYDANLVGIPRLHTLTERITPQGTTTYTKINKGDDATATGIKSDWIGEKIHGFGKTMKFWGDLQDDDYYDDTEEIKKAPSTAPKVPFSLPPLLQFLTKGITFNDTYNPNIHSIHISGVKYRCDGLNFNEKIDVLFDGEQFWLRTENGLRAITYPREFVRENPMVWQTLFPFFDAAADTHTPIDNSLPDSNDEI